MSGNDSYQFVDTNLLVYAHDRSAGIKQQQSQTLLQTLWEAKTGCLSIQVFQEFYIIITRKVANPLSSAQASQIISHLGAWRIHSPNTTDIQQAIDIQGRYQVSFWDAMILQSAIRLGCSTVWSEDLSAGQHYGTVVVSNPFEMNLEGE